MSASVESSYHASSPDRCGGGGGTGQRDGSTFVIRNSLSSDTCDTPPERVRQQRQQKQQGGKQPPSHDDAAASAAAAAAPGSSGSSPRTSTGAAVPSATGPPTAAAATTLEVTVFVDDSREARSLGPPAWPLPASVEELRRRLEEALRLPSHAVAHVAVWSAAAAAYVPLETVEQLTPPPAAASAGAPAAGRRAVGLWVHTTRVRLEPVTEAAAAREWAGLAAHVRRTLGNARVRFTLEEATRLRYAYPAYAFEQEQQRQQQQQTQEGEGEAPAEDKKKAKKKLLYYTNNVWGTGEALRHGFVMAAAPPPWPVPLSGPAAAEASGSGGASSSGGGNALERPFVFASSMLDAGERRPRLPGRQRVLLCEVAARRPLLCRQPLLPPAGGGGAPARQHVVPVPPPYDAAEYRGPGGATQVQLARSHTALPRYLLVVRPEAPDGGGSRATSRSRSRSSGSAERAAARGSPRRPSTGAVLDMRLGSPSRPPSSADRRATPPPPPAAAHTQAPPPQPLVVVPSGGGSGSATPQSSARRPAEARAAPRRQASPELLLRRTPSLTGGRPTSSDSPAASRDPSRRSSPGTARAAAADALPPARTFSGDGAGRASPVRAGGGASAPASARRPSPTQQRQQRQHQQPVSAAKETAAAAARPVGITSRPPASASAPRAQPRRRSTPSRDRGSRVSAEQPIHTRELSRSRRAPAATAAAASGAGAGGSDSPAAASPPARSQTRRHDDPSPPAAAASPAPSASPAQTILYSPSFTDLPPTPGAATPPRRGGSGSPRRRSASRQKSPRTAAAAAPAPTVVAAESAKAGLLYSGLDRQQRRQQQQLDGSVRADPLAQSAVSNLGASLRYPPGTAAAAAVAAADPSVPAVLRCAQHPEQLTTLYCRACEALVCPVCGSVGDHRGHDVLPAEDHARVVHANLRALCAELRGWREHFAATQAALAGEAAAWRQREAERVRRVAAQFAELRAALAERERQVMADIRADAAHAAPPVEAAAAVTRKYEAALAPLEQSLRVFQRATAAAADRREREAHAIGFLRAAPRAEAAVLREMRASDRRQEAELQEAVERFRAGEERQGRRARTLRLDGVRHLISRIGGLELRDGGAPDVSSILSESPRGSPARARSPSPSLSSGAGGGGGLAERCLHDLQRGHLWTIEGAAALFCVGQDKAVCSQPFQLRGALWEVRVGPLPAPRPLQPQPLSRQPSGALAPAGRAPRAISFVPAQAPGAPPVAVLGRTNSAGSFTGSALADGGPAALAAVSYDAAVAASAAAPASSPDQWLGLFLFPVGHQNRMDFRVIAFSEVLWLEWTVTGWAPGYRGRGWGLFPFLQRRDLTRTDQLARDNIVKICIVPISDLY